MKASFSFGALALALGILFPAAAQVPTHYQQLMFLDSSRTFGGNPTAALVFGRYGLLYGATESGGAANGGAVIAVSSDGTSRRLVFPFNRGQGGIAVQAGRLAVGVDGTLYGTAQTGGSGNGMVFRVNPDGSGFKVLHGFGSVTNDGYNVLAGVAISGGSLFGVTDDDFTTNRAGVIFKLNLDGTGYQILHQFSTNAVTGATVDGSNPLSGLIVGQDGALYGATRSGGSTLNFPFGPGTIYRINPDGGDYAVLHAFSFSDGYDASAELIQTTDGRLFGTTPFGGSLDSGTVFTVNTNGTGFSVIYSFTNSIAGGATVQPSALTIAPDGGFYGATAYSGITNAAFPRGMGTVFKMNSDGSGYTTVYTFNGEDGANPQAALALAADGTLFGTTQSGGFLNQGAVFKLSPTSTGAPSIIDFIAPSGGAQLTVSGAPMALVSLQLKTDLASPAVWQTTITTNLDAFGLAQINQPYPANAPNLFIRAATP